jgi:hypothetical protein
VELYGQWLPLINEIRRIGRQGYHAFSPQP